MIGNSFWELNKKYNVSVAGNIRFEDIKCDGRGKDVFWMWY